MRDVPQALTCRTPDLPSLPMPPADLPDLDRSLLAFESQWWKRPGAKDQAIRDRFGITPTRYMQLLNKLIDQPAALAYDPVVVNRLRRLRERREALRARSRAA